MSSYTAEKAVSGEVFCNVSMLITELLKNTDSLDSEWYEELFMKMEEDEDNYQESFIEPLSFWAVSARLASFLKEQGHPVTDYFGTWIWGRPTYGQLIRCDAVIEDFAEEINNQTL